jgi:hypothetical protein
MELQIGLEIPRSVISSCNIMSPMKKKNLLVVGEEKRLDVTSARDIPPNHFFPFVYYYYCNSALICSFRFPTNTCME